MEATMRKLCIFVVVAFFVFSIGALLAQNAASNSCSNPGEVKSMVNPVKPAAESLAQGKKYYGYDCAMCHGATGNGKGEVDTGDKLPDFTNADSMKVMSDGQIFCSLKTGKGCLSSVSASAKTSSGIWSTMFVRWPNKSC